MRSRDEVIEKFRQLYAKHLKQMEGEYLSRQPINCVCNNRHRVRKQGIVGFCSNQEVLVGCKQFVFVCNDEETAKKCPYYSCKNTEETVRLAFDDILKNPAFCGQKFPKLAILIWFLQEDKTPNPDTRKKSLLERIGEHFGRSPSEQ